MRWAVIFVGGCRRISHWARERLARTIATAFGRRGESRGHAAPIIVDHDPETVGGITVDYNPVIPLAGEVVPENKRPPRKPVGDWPRERPGARPRPTEPLPTEPRPTEPGQRNQRPMDDWSEDEIRAAALRHRQDLRRRRGS